MSFFDLISEKNNDRLSANPSESMKYSFRQNMRQVKISKYDKFVQRIAKNGLLGIDGQELDKKSADRAKSVKKRVLIVTDSSGQAFKEADQLGQFKRNSLIEHNSDTMLKNDYDVGPLHHTLDFGQLNPLKIPSQLKALSAASPQKQSGRTQA